MVARDAFQEKQVNARLLIFGILDMKALKSHSNDSSDTESVNFSCLLHAFKAKLTR